MAAAQRLIYLRGKCRFFCWQQIIALSANRDGVVTGQGLTWKLGNRQNFPTFNNIILYCDKTVALMLTIMTQQWQKIAKARSMQACMVSPISNCFFNSTPPWERTFGHLVAFRELFPNCFKTFFGADERSQDISYTWSGNQIAREQSDNGLWIDCKMFLRIDGCVYQSLNRIDTKVW